MEARIRQLEADLAAAQSRKERAIAQAQLTKVGHVYVISNIGAFGEGIVKIGLTRRLDPEERVHELGGASVPFPFDIHAMIYSDNAPEMETCLHEHFWDKRLNWFNNRKEFFRIELAEVQGELASRLSWRRFPKPRSTDRLLRPFTSRSSRRPRWIARSGKTVFPPIPSQTVLQAIGWLPARLPNQSLRVLSPSSASPSHHDFSNACTPQNCDSIGTYRAANLGHGAPNNPPWSR
jgi:hypothetical protein